MNRNTQVVKKPTEKELKEARKYIKENTHPHMDAGYYDDWGYGQMKDTTLELLVHFGRQEGMEFLFYKKVTALCDIDWVSKTIRTDKNHLFVFPATNVDDMTRIWNKVDAVKKNGK